ncbi:MAG: septal ring lytic transglycosylase RlpA family protein [Hyphomicrobium sp.]
MAALLAACSNGADTQATRYDGARSSVSRPLFTEEDYGVKTSPRLATSRGPLPKGGGSYKLGSPYSVAGRWYVPRNEPGYDRQGTGSWYGDDFHGRKTANGELFDMNALTAAHPTLPLPSYAYVTNLENGRTILVRVNDRGPYVGDRMIDLSHTSARALGYDGKGKASVRVRYAGRAPLNGDDRRERQYLAGQPWYRGGPITASADMPRTAPVDVPEQFPAGTAGRWSPTSYREALAGKSRPQPPAAAPRDSAPAYDVAQDDRTARARAAPARNQWDDGDGQERASARADGQDRGGGRGVGGGGMQWVASPRGVPVTETGGVVQAGLGAGARNLADQGTSGAARARRLAPDNGVQGYDEAAAGDGSSTMPSAEPGQSYVQVGVYREQANADRVRRSLSHLGPIEVAPLQAADGRVFRVRIGPMGTGQAEQAQRQVAAEGISGSAVVTE